MELSWIEDFLALVKCGSFSRAVEQRHVTRPAFRRRIRALENWVGTPLFDRSFHQVMPAGRTDWELPIEICLLRPAARQEAVLEEFWSHARDSADRVSCPGTP